MRNKIGLIFGSFNPVHEAHLELAKYILKHQETYKISEIWFVPSPQNPFKDQTTLWDFDLRVKILRQSIAFIPHTKVCDVEASLSRPSYTYVTLRALREKYDFEFVLLGGTDLLLNMGNWKNIDEILNLHHWLLFERPNYEAKIYEPFLEDLQKKGANIELIKDLKINISSTEIRNKLKVNHLLPQDYEIQANESK